MSPCRSALGYIDECTTFRVSYAHERRARSPSRRAEGPHQTVLVRLELRTLGEANVRQNIGGSATQDGVVTR